jgi:integrase
MKPFRTYIFEKKHRSGKTTWVVRWKNLDTGQWCYAAAGKTREEAQLIEAKVRQELYRGEDPKPKKNLEPEMTVSAMINLFYQSPRFLNSSLKWKKVLKGQLENIIRPQLGSSRFSELKSEKVFKIYLGLKESGLSHSTIRKYHNTLSVLGQMYAELNPGKDNLIGKIKDFHKYFPRQAPTREINFLTTEEIQLILKELSKTKSKNLLPLVHLLACSGLRRSEALSLKWNDIEWGEGFIHVRDSKNGTARRVPLEPGSIAALKFFSHRSGLIFANEEGYICHPDSLLLGFQRAVRRAGINKRVDLHSLRHSYGSNKIRQGWGLKKVSKILGHSDISITSEVYTHLLDGDLKVSDEFHFDKVRSSANSEGEGIQHQTMSTIVTQLIEKLGSMPKEVFLQSNFSEMIDEAVAQGMKNLSSDVSKPHATTTLPKKAPKVPHMPRRAETAPFDPLSAARADSKLSCDFKSLGRKKMVCPIGIEPTTFSFGG